MEWRQRVEDVETDRPFVHLRVLAAERVGEDEATDGVTCEIIDVSTF